MTLPYTRFVRQVSNGGSFSKYGYIDLMKRNAKALETAPWREARCAPNAVSLTVGQLTRTDGQTDEDGRWTSTPSYTAWLDDRYDVFAQGGDAVSKMATLCGYAGCVAYRFTLPTEHRSAMTALTLALQRDRYLRAGVRMAIAFSNSATPSDDWSGVIHPSASTSSVHVTPSTAAEAGVVGVTCWGFMGQPDVPFLLAGRAAGSSYTLAAADFAGLATAAESTYMYVYLTLEDPAAYWDLYSAAEQRYYYIEGSAVLMPSQCDFTFADAAAAVTDSWIVSPPWPMDDARNAMLNAIESAEEVFKFAPDGFRLVPMAGAIVPAGDLPLVCATALRQLTSLPHRLIHAPDGSAEVGLGGNTSDWGDPTTYIRLTAMNRFANWPCTARGTSCGLFALLRHGGASETAYDLIPEASSSKSYLGFNGYTQICFGYLPYIVPPDKASYTRMRIQGGAGRFTAQHCTVSLNIWRSTSPDLFGEFSNVAMAALAQHPELFTGGQEVVSGEASFSLYDPAETDSHTPIETISVKATATLIANVDATPLTTGDLVIEGLHLLPGDFLLVVPNVESVDPAAAYDGEGRNEAIFFGKPGLSDLATLTPAPTIGGNVTAAFA